MENDPRSASIVSRRDFLQVSVGTVAATGGVMSARPVLAAGGKPALLGGTPIHSGKWPGWPISDAQDQAALQQVLRSGDWNRS